MKNCKFIMFSGGCYSGKTTTMELAKEIFEKQGIKVVMLDEIVRKYNITSIDNLRKNPVKYLSFQNTVIRAKIGAEILQFVKNEKCIVLADRAITDSLFYLLFYVDKSNLEHLDMHKFNMLYEIANKHAIKAFNEIYDIIIEFAPLTQKSTVGDIYRPEKIDIMKYIENRMISSLNNAYLSEDEYGNCTYVKVDLNNENTNMHLFFKTIGEKTLKQWEQLSV